DQLIDAAQDRASVQDPGQVGSFGLGALVCRTDDPAGDLPGFSLDPWMGCWSQSVCEIGKMPFDLG
ncbi:hypothetical protein, partial [Nocardia amamiensis]|uniref:hypothetical protein n=1 Tax=Nocardia amamiensis TaxID=404578 RepID=UPI001E3955AD